MIKHSNFGVAIVPTIPRMYLQSPHFLNQSGNVFAHSRAIMDAVFIRSPGLKSMIVLPAVVVIM